MPSRRNSIELTDAEIRAFLDSNKTLIIVSNGKDGYPHPMPMWFYVDDEGVSTARRSASRRRSTTGTGIRKPLCSWRAAPNTLNSKAW